MVGVRAPGPGHDRGVSPSRFPAGHPFAPTVCSATGSAKDTRPKTSPLACPWTVGGTPRPSRRPMATATSKDACPRFPLVVLRPDDGQRPTIHKPRRPCPLITGSVVRVPGRCSARGVGETASGKRRPADGPGGHQREEQTTQLDSVPDARGGPSNTAEECARLETSPFELFAHGHTHPLTYPPNVVGSREWSGRLVTEIRPRAVRVTVQTDDQFVRAYRQAHPVRRCVGTWSKWPSRGHSRFQTSLPCARSRIWRPGVRATPVRHPHRTSAC